MGNRSDQLINDGKTVLFAFEEAIGIRTIFNAIKFINDVVTIL